MAKFLLKVKTKTGPKIINNLSLDSNISELMTSLFNATNINISCLHVLHGFPPKPIDLSNGTKKILETGITSGDTLIVEERIRPLTEAGSCSATEPVAETGVHRPGVLMKKVVPADNSCLFTSVGFVLNGRVDTSMSPFMREIIAREVTANELQYSAAVLGRPNDEYCAWIMQDDSWGGAIELSVLSRFYGLELAVVDSQNAILNRFGEDQDYGQRAFLLFDGVHYDPLYLESMEGSIQTIFPSEDQQMLREAEQLAREARASRQFTDLKRFTVKCMDCNALLTGQAQAQTHARESAHTNFGEV